MVLSILGGVGSWRGLRTQYRLGGAGGIQCILEGAGGGKGLMSWRTLLLDVGR